MSYTEQYLPGVLVRYIGGGGKFVPLIGDTQEFSSISCCNTDKYEEITQNSSNVMLCVSQFVSNISDVDDDCDKNEDDDDDSVELNCVNSLRLFSTSLTKLKIRFKFSLDTRSLR